MLGSLRSVRRLARNSLGRLSTAQLLDGYLLAKRAAGRAPATLETIAKRIGRLAAYLGDQDPSTELIRHWLVALKQGRTGRETSDVYVEDHRKEAAAFFEWCVLERHLARSPMAVMKPYRVTKPQVRTITREEIRRLIDQEPLDRTGARNRAVLALMYDTGIRVGELVRLRLSDVDLEAGTLRITAKGRAIDSAPLSPACRSELWSYIHRARPPELFTGLAELFVSTKGGGALSTNAIRVWMRRAKIRAGIDPAKRVSPHVIRSSAATHFAVDGASEFMVQRFLRHKDPSMSRRYVRVAELELARVHAAASPYQRLALGGK